MVEMVETGGVTPASGGPTPTDPGTPGGPVTPQSEDRGPPGEPPTDNNTNDSRAPGGARIPGGSPTLAWIDYGGDGGIGAGSGGDGGDGADGSDGSDGWRRGASAAVTKVRLLQ